MTKRALQVRKAVKALKFASLRAQGYSQIEAWRAITPNWAEIKDKSQHEMASQFAADPHVRLKVNEVLQNATAAALSSTARYVAKMQDYQDWAVGLEKANAVAQFAKLEGQALELLRNSGTLTVEHSVAAGKLVDQLKSLGISPEAAEEFRPRTSFSSEGETKH